jgi:hypothetical protein
VRQARYRQERNHFSRFGGALAVASHAAPTQLTRVVPIPAKFLQSRNTFDIGPTAPAAAAGISVPR